MHRVFQWRKVSRKASLIKDQINLFQSWPKTILSLLPRAIQFCQLERNIFVSNSRDAERDGGSAAVTPQNTREEFPRPLFQLWTEVGSRQWVVQPQLGTRIQCSSISAHEFKWKWCPDCLYIYIMPGFLCIPGDCLPLVTQLAGGQLLGSGSTIVYHGNKLHYTSAPAHSAHLVGGFINLT